MSTFKDIHYTVEHTYNPIKVPFTCRAFLLCGKALVSLRSPGIWIVWIVCTEKVRNVTGPKDYLSICKVKKRNVS